MKKFFVLLILATAVGAGWYFYDPYLKPYVDSMKAKYGESGAGDGDAQPTSPSATAPAGPTATPGVADPGTAQKPVPGNTPSPAPAPVPVAPALSEIDKLLEQKYPLPAIPPLMQVVDNWNNVPNNAYPTEVALKERVAFAIPGVGSSIAVPGTLVRPSSLSGDTLTVASLANLAMRTKVNVDATDFKDRIQQNYNDFVVNTTERVRKQRDAAREVLQAEPEALAAASMTGSDSSDDPRFGSVKESLARGDMPSVRLEEAKSYRWVGKQKIRGKLKGEYDCVLVAFEVDTIFGMFPTEWLAVLENGRVLGWVDPITHETSAMVPE